MVDEQTRLRELLAELETTLAGLREKQGVTKREYETDRDRQDIVERRLEKATQTCIDIGRRICRIEGYDIGDEPNAAVFVTLVEAGILPESRQQEFVDIAGLRNILVHRYRHIDTTEIYESYHDLDRLERFSEAVYLYIQNESNRKS